MQDLPPTLLKVLNLGYLFLPLGLALVGGLCLLIAAARKTLTGGTALALGGLCGLIVAGSVSLGAVERTAEAARAPAPQAAPAATVATTGAQPASVAAPSAAGEATASAPAKPGSLRAKTYRWASMGYAILPLALAALSGLALLISVFGKTLNGASALGLGGLCGVVVLGSVLGLHGSDGEGVCPLGFGDRGTIAQDAQGATPQVDVDAEQEKALQAMGNALETLKATLDARIMPIEKATGKLDEKSDTLLSQGSELNGKLQAIAQHLSALDQQVSGALKSAATAEEKANAAKAAADAAAAKADANRAPSSAPATTPPSAPAAPAPGSNGG